jgi:hypothetical protein
MVKIQKLNNFTETKISSFDYLSNDEEKLSNKTEKVEENKVYEPSAIEIFFTKL